MKDIDDDTRIMFIIKIQTSLQIKRTQGKGIRKLPSKQLLQRIAILYAQVQAQETSENILNKIRQIFYSLYCAKQISKKVYNNLIKSRMNTIFTNSENSKISDAHRLRFNLRDKITL